MGLSKKLIVNADGFGFGPGATQGIFEAIQEGEFISSVSVNANFPDAERVQEFIAQFPHVSIGVHVNPLAGSPCLPVSKVPSLVNKDGTFFEHQSFIQRMRAGAISLSELEAEFDAQIGKIHDLTSGRITHLDSQGNSHVNYLDLFLKLARKWGIERCRNNASLICLETENPKLSRWKAYLCQPHVWIGHKYRIIQMRKIKKVGIRMADSLVTVGYGGIGGKFKLDNWTRVLRNLPEGICEIYCHPAYPDSTLRQWASYCEERIEELNILRSPKLREIARELGVEIISFNEI